MPTLCFLPTQLVKEAFIGRGIYRLYREGRIVYVGQAKCISARIHVHWTERQKDFDGFDYLLMPDASAAAMDEAEASEIFRLKPEYNRALPRTGRHLRLTQIAHQMKVRPMKLQRFITANAIECFLGLYDTAMFEGVSRESLV
ncbi:hypothetical protein [Mesorhizobium sp. ES1-1]|uniref:hypothetical protein n=1 Tax=Mesorhizobium sp. ES1-1 TaxID=2876629 RepID=UPI001CCA7209|nr:hypothetical protein [Mesorhizobium sp. ES1-1]MBZ9674520.1 hypothetical protein [Mesorhizobium sp. ES1-1]